MLTISLLSRSASREKRPIMIDFEMRKIIIPERNPRKPKIKLSSANIQKIVFSSEPRILSRETSRIRSIRETVNVLNIPRIAIITPIAPSAAKIILK